MWKTGYRPLPVYGVPYITGKTGQRIVSWIKYYFLHWPHFAFCPLRPVRQLVANLRLHGRRGFVIKRGRIEEQACHAPLATKPGKLATFLWWFRWHFKASYNKAVKLNRSWSWTSISILLFIDSLFSSFFFCKPPFISLLQPFWPFLYIDSYFICAPFHGCDFIWVRGTWFL